MSIELYTGTPGSGKSLDACRTIRRALKRGQHVITNFEVNVNEDCKGTVSYYPNNELNPGVLVAFAHDHWASNAFKEDSILIVIDEAQLIWNSRLWNSDPFRMQWLELFSQHRKYGMRIILICQSDIMIDRQFRTLVEYEVRHIKVGHLGLLGMIMKSLSFGELFYAKSFYYGEKVKVDSYFFRYSKKLGSMYDTLNTFAQLPAGTAKAVTARDCAM